AGAGPFFSLGSTLTAPPGRVSFDLLLSYFSRPIGLQVSSADPGGTTIYPLDNVLDATLLWGIGITDRLELTAVAPVALLQDGVGLGPVLGTDDELVRSAIRDLRFGAAVRILARPRVGVEKGTALTGRLEFGLPVGTTSAFA